MRLVVYRRLSPSLSLFPTARGFGLPKHAQWQDESFRQGSVPSYDNESRPALVDGIDVSFAQLQALLNNGRQTPLNYIEHHTENSRQEDSTTRTICRLAPSETIEDVETQLHHLSRLITSMDSNIDKNYEYALPPFQIDQVIVPHRLNALQGDGSVFLRRLDSLADWVSSYLYRVVPLCAQFLETHPSIGSYHGQHNAHGKPLDTHVVGVCHDFYSCNMQGTMEGTSNSQLQGCDAFFEFSQRVVDMLPPTRLSLPVWSSNNKNTTDCDETRNVVGGSSIISMEMEAMIQGTDHLCFLDNGKAQLQEDDSSPSLLHHHIWDWQQRIGAKEAYATCIDNGTTVSTVREAFRKGI